MTSWPNLSKERKRGEKRSWFLRGLRVEKLSRVRFIFNFSSSSSNSRQHGSYGEWQSRSRSVKSGISNHMNRCVNIYVKFLRLEKKDYRGFIKLSSDWLICKQIWPNSAKYFLIDDRNTHIRIHIKVKRALIIYPVLVRGRADLSREHFLDIYQFFPRRWRYHHNLINQNASAHSYFRT